MTTLNRKAECYYDAYTFYKGRRDTKAARIAYKKYQEVKNQKENIMTTLNRKAECYYDAYTFYKERRDTKAARIAYKKYQEVKNQIVNHINYCSK